MKPEYLLLYVEDSVGHTYRVVRFTKHGKCYLQERNLRIKQGKWQDLEEEDPVGQNPVVVALEYCGYKPA